MSEKQTNPILIVDDDLNILKILKIFINKTGYEAITCESAKEALKILRTQDIKLALLDICMPDMSGVELLQIIQKITPSTQVIMVTGLGDMGIAQKCMRLGAKDFITKPFDFDYLKTSVVSEFLLQ